jgi:flagellar M-ring protein FliF
VSNNRTRKKVTNNQFEINRIVSNMMQTPGGIKRLSAAVFVAARSSITGTNRVAVQRTPEEMQKIRRIVQSALGIQENDPNRHDEITVEEMPFNEQIATELTRQLDTDRRRQWWWEAAKSVVYPLLALGLLASFWWAFHKTPATDIPIGVPIKDFAGTGNGHAAAPARSTTGSDADVLNQLIRENPGNMTHALRSWMQRGKN